MQKAIGEGAHPEWPFAPGALSEDTAQAQEDKDRQRQEDDGVNVHAASLSQSTRRHPSGV
jgi:hypothetical protein